MKKVFRKPLQVKKTQIKCPNVYPELAAYHKSAAELHSQVSWAVGDTNLCYVFSDRVGSKIGRLIKHFSKGSVSHGMVIYKRDFANTYEPLSNIRHKNKEVIFEKFEIPHLIDEPIVVSQEAWVKQKPLSDWLQGKHYVEIWELAGPSPEAVLRVQQWIEHLFERPWYKKTLAWMRYDALGVVGHALRMPWLQVPWLRYCSELQADILNEQVGVYPAGKHPHPEKLRLLFRKIRIIQLTKELVPWMNDCQLRFLGYYDPRMEL